MFCNYNTILYSHKPTNIVGSNQNTATSLTKFINSFRVDMRMSLYYFRSFLDYREIVLFTFCDVKLSTFIVKYKTFFIFCSRCINSTCYNTRIPPIIILVICPLFYGRLTVSQREVMTV